jgi:hypothetical protein
MSTKAEGLRVEEISGWIQKAATAEPGELATGSFSAPASDGHSIRIQAAIARARKKTYVRVIKPLRGLFRNQGAVNDSLIEAVHHLNAQNQDLLEQVQDLRALVHRLRSQLRRMPADESLSLPHASEQKPISTALPDRVD